MKEARQMAVIGASAGGLEALGRLLGCLSGKPEYALAIVQHLPPGSSEHLAYLSGRSVLPLKEAEDKELPECGVVYLAPPDYHLLVDLDGRFTLSADPRVNFSRPAIDELFRSAAEYYRQDLIAVLLSGMSRDGSDGIAAVRRNGGVAIVLDPSDTGYPFMPATAIKEAGADFILTMPEICMYFKEIAGGCCGKA